MFDTITLSWHNTQNNEHINTVNTSYSVCIFFASFSQQMLDFTHPPPPPFPSSLSVTLQVPSTPGMLLQSLRVNLTSM